MSDHQAAAIEIGSTNMILSPAPAAGMYWSRCLTYGHGPSKPIRAHTANLVGEKLYVFGGCDTSSCFNILYILDMGKVYMIHFLLSSQAVTVKSSILNRYHDLVQASFIRTF